MKKSDSVLTAGRRTKRHRDFLLFLFIVFQPLLDVLAFWTSSETGTAAGYIRLAMMAGMVLYVLVRRFSFRVLAAFLATGAIFALHVLNCARVGYLSIVTDVKYISKVIFMPVMAICLCSLIRDEADERQIFQGLFVSGCIEAVIILLSYLTDTYTYTYTIEKLGISGWVIDSNRCCHSDILSTVAVFACCIGLKCKNKAVAMLIPLLVFVLLITNGTTACYLTLLAVMAGFPIFMILSSRIRKTKPDATGRAAMLVMAVLFALSLVIYPVTPRSKMEELENSSYSENERLFAEKMAGLGYNIYSMSLEEKLQDPVFFEELTDYYNKFICSTVESLRDNYPVERIIRTLNGTVSAEVLGDTRNMKRLNAQFIFEDSDMLTRFTGFEFSNLQHDYEDLENDWYAIYYYYGYIGIAAYLCAAVYIYIRVIKTLFRDFQGSFTVENFALLCCFTLQLGLAFFSGAMLRRPNASVYLSVTTALLYCHTKNNRQVVEK